ncbi:hypothetical protein [Amycolatopsis sp. lyj-108]|uniref:hypothetical protein n=1 Tax=Amycolatopsis sp. lyj-108 TaxID=2789286 RepID=UPI0039796FD1
MGIISAAKATAKALDKTAEFVAKNRSQVVMHTGNGLPKTHCGGCGKRARTTCNGYGHCGKFACQQKIAAKSYS